MKDIVIIAGGGQAQNIISILSEKQRGRLLGYVDISDKGVLSGVPYLGNDDFLIGKQNTLKLIIGLSYLGVKVDIDLRKNLINQFSKSGFEFERVISEKSIIHQSVLIGEGTVVFPGVIISVGVNIGKNCLINSGAIIEHDCILHDNIQMSPGVIVSGGVEILDNTFIGSGAVLRDSITIGPNIIIGMGAIVAKSIFEQGTYYTRHLLQ